MGSRVDDGGERLCIVFIIRGQQTPLKLQERLVPSVTVYHSEGCHIHLLS